MPTTLSPLSETIEPLGYVVDDKGAIFKQTKSRQIPKKFGSLSSVLVGEDLYSFCKDYLKEFPIPVHIAKGEDIHEVFEKHRPGSCMRYAFCREMRQVYADNPEIVSVAYWKKGEHEFCESDGSFLVWQYEDLVLLDRTYTSGFYPRGDIFLRSVARQLCSEFGCDYTSLRVIYGSFSDVSPVDASVSIELTNPSNRPLAYADSFRFVESYGDDFVVVANHEPATYTARLEDTHGTLPNGDQGVIPKCCSCNNMVNLETCQRTHHDEPVCENCAEACSCCGHVYTTDAIEKIEAIGEDSPRRICYSCRDTNYRYLYENGRYALENLTVVDGQQRFILKENAVLTYLGHWQSRDQCTKLCTGEYALTDECRTLHDGRVVHAHQICFVGNRRHHIDDCVVVGHSYHLKTDVCTTFDGNKQLLKDCVELYDGGYALKKDAIKTHTGEYTVMEKPYPNFVIRDLPNKPNRIKRNKDELVASGYSTRIYHVKGLPLILATSLGSTFLYSAERGGWLIGRMTNTEPKTALATAKAFWATLSDEIREDIYQRRLTPDLAEVLSERFRSFRRYHDGHNELTISDILGL